jgi:hypothetical protein
LFVLPTRRGRRTRAARVAVDALFTSKSKTLLKFYEE